MKFKTFLFALTVAALATSCKKSASTTTTPDAPYVCTTCNTTPDALPANDASSKGIYKGVVVGSTGTIKFDINNSGTAITAKLVIDGVTVNLTSAVTWVAGTGYIAPFTGTLNGSPVTINFSVGATGSTPTITSSNIPGHPGAVFNISKETSASLVEAFEGTYSSTQPENGTFNLIVSPKLGTYYGISKVNGANNYGYPSGTIVNNNFIDPQSGVVATLNGDVLTGKYISPDRYTITVSGKRTL